MKIKLSIIGLATIFSSNVSAEIAVNSPEFSKGILTTISYNMLATGVLMATATGIIGIYFFGRRLSTRIINTMHRTTKVRQNRQTSICDEKVLNNNSQKDLPRQKLYEENDLRKLSVPSQSSNMVGTSEQSVMTASNSIASLLNASANADLVVAKHCVVILIEMIRRAKQMASQINESADQILKQSTLVESRGLKLTVDLLEAVILATTAKGLSLKVMSVSDTLELQDPGALLLWHRTKFDECVSSLSAARAKLIPALEKWESGVKQYRNELVERANVHQNEAELAYSQAANFIEVTQIEGSYLTSESEVTA